MNVLLSCGGRRNYLLSYFKEAIGNEGRVCVCDSSPNAPTMYEADVALVVPHVAAPGYIDCLLEICREQEIALLVSLNDLELPVLAPVRERFEDIGTRLTVSPKPVVDLAFDKWRTLIFLDECGLKGPASVLTLEEAITAIDNGLLSFPLVVKPRWGTASIGIEAVYDRKELDLAFQLTHRRIRRTILAEISSTDAARSVLVQEWVKGIEYGVDIVNDLDGNHKAVFVKRKLSMRAGETDRAVTENQQQVTEAARKIGRTLGHVANLDCDIFLTSDGPIILEMNPRFGGGYPFSHVAGTNLPAALLAWARGMEPDPSWLTVQNNIIASKCDRLVLKRPLNDSPRTN